MPEPREGRIAETAPGGEQATQDVLPEESRSAPADRPWPGGKVTAEPDQIEGCSTDTITDDDGHYLEPPD